MQLVGYFRRGDGDAHGRAIGDALGHGHDVWLHAPMLDAEPVFAGASKAGLDLIADEEPPIASDDTHCDLKVFRRRGDKTAHPLDGLGQEGSHPA